MTESLLDDVPGMSTVRKRALLKHFGSVTEIKKLTVTELQKVEGVGPKSAERIIEWFSRG